jgi:DNA polymerase-3 subunit delta'
MAPGEQASVWDVVVGQPVATRQLRAASGDPVHAYLFVGPAGSTKDRAARAFAAVLLSGGESTDDRHARLALAGEHPDVREVHRAGATISKDQVAEIIRNASLAPVEGARKVMILHEFHLLDANGAARLLKTIEEPPPSTTFVILADQVTPDLVTVASRCVRIDFGPVPNAEIVAALVAHGVDQDAAEQAATAAEGNLDRAAVLATDEGLAARRAMFANIPTRLDGTGAAVVTAVRDVLAAIDAAAEPITRRHEAEIVALDERVAASGERGSGRKQLEERHRREQRRHRTDELRGGLAVMAGALRDALVGGHPRPDAIVDAIDRIHHALEALERNPNETLLLQRLLLQIPSLPGR